MAVNVCLAFVSPVDIIQWDVRSCLVKYLIYTDGTTKYNSNKIKYYKRIITANINTATDTGYRSGSLATNIPYDDDYVYLITQSGIQNITIIYSVSNSIIIGKLCVIVTSPVSVNLGDIDIYIIAIKK